MDTPGTELSSDSSDSADSSPAESTPAQTVQSVPSSQKEDPVHANDTGVAQDDSDSDVSMSAETDDEDDEAPRASTIQVNPVGQVLAQSIPLATINGSMETSNKRKFQDSTEFVACSYATYDATEEIRKRLKPEDEVQSLETCQGASRQDKSSLPAEIWHRIFTFIPPRNLGLLLRVNKCFNAYLDPSSSKFSSAPLSNSALKLLKADAIWRASRALFRPGMPAPLTGKSELDMWKLACSSTCNFCERRQTIPLQKDQWHPGPGENGDVPIWSFGVRMCGACLKQQSLKVGKNKSLYFLIH